ncbi:DUF1614 domain-containing protein [Methanoregula sp.]|jgi:uncharacterized membrane protein|uniref:DUF1614 domain-containing protein n=1 Tax=Methanoregula sp. TaxID=2052170 RepID=UPI0025CDF1BB|nr:DUF1614 domain-containing protein [Methanoregula sp.]
MPNDIRVYSAGPLTILALIVIIGLLVIVVPLLFLGFVGKAFTSLVGLSWLTATALVILILLCSLVNIPVWKIRRETIRMPHNETPDAFTPNEEGGLWETTIAVNLGGAIIPLAMACYLLYRASAVMSGNTLYFQVLAATLIVAAMAYVTTRAMVGVGIRAPLFVPGLTALLCGILLSGGFGLSAGVIAFVSGTLGTLLGADIAHLPHVGDLEVPQVSIGGAGTFGAIFIGCILSALIAS